MQFRWVGHYPFFHQFGTLPTRSGRPKNTTATGRKTMADRERSLKMYARTQKEIRPIYDWYFEITDKVKEAIEERQYEKAIEYCKTALPHLNDYVRAQKKENLSLGLGNKLAENFGIPVIEEGCRLMAILEDSEGLKEVATLVANNPDLRPWIEVVNRAFKDVSIVRRVQELVKAEPGLFQKDLRHLIKDADGPHISSLCYLLTQTGRLKRHKEGRFVVLFPG